MAAVGDLVEAALPADTTTLRDSPNQRVRNSLAQVQVNECDLIHWQVLDGWQQLCREAYEEGHGRCQVVGQ